MKLSDVKEDIDNYFENIDAQDLYDISISKYNMIDEEGNRLPDEFKNEMLELQEQATGPTCDEFIASFNIKDKTGDL